jgi:hypothetical protein
MRLPLQVSTWVGAALLAASGALYAQGAPDKDKAKDKPGAMRMRDCSKAPDPKACEERMAKMKAAHEKARAACEGKARAEHAACMREQMCAQAKDPAKCEAEAKARGEKVRAAVARARKACEGKQAEERRECMRREMCAQAKDPAQCEAHAKERAEKRKSSK